MGISWNSVIRPSQIMKTFSCMAISGVNQMLILKNSKELLEHLQSPNFNHITSIKSFDSSTISTTIPNQQTRNYHLELYYSQKWKSQIQIFGLRSRRTVFVKEYSDSKYKYTDDDIINMLEFLVDTIFMVFGERFSNR